MTKIWLIAGAFSGVGKTTIVSNLMEILPDVQFLKIGTSRRKKSGRENYFTSTEEGIRFIEAQMGKCSHCLVESNRLVGSIDADLIIFLDNLDGDRRDDADRLRTAADVIIGYRGNQSQWENNLKSMQLPVKTRNKVIDAFNNQQEFLRWSRLSLRTKIWIRRDGKVVFGEGLARLLYGIDTKGSLSRAAKEEKISYRHAWGDIKRAEERLGFALLKREVGGTSGGGSQLTEEGRKLLEGYDMLKNKTIRETDKWFKKLFMDII